MEAKAVVMGLLGFFLLYGGFAYCVGIAWYHSQRMGSGGAQETKEPAEE